MSSTLECLDRMSERALVRIGARLPDQRELGIVGRDQLGEAFIGIDMRAAAPHVDGDARRDHAQPARQRAGAAIRRDCRRRTGLADEQSLANALDDFVDVDRVAVDLARGLPNDRHELAFGECERAGVAASAVAT